MKENIDENKINLSQHCVGPADDTPGTASGADRVRFRPICRADYPILAELINSTWGFDKMHDDPIVLRHFGLRYLYTCLIKHTFALVAEIDGKAAGIIIEADYGADHTSLKYLALYYYHTAYLTLRRAFSAFHDVNERYDRIMREMDDFCKEKGITVIMSLHEIDLAQKISDKILCVKGDTIFGYGEPEAIFKEDFIQKLYEIDNGHFDPLFGSVELAKAEGEAEVFVISSGGCGIPVYRNLQKAKIPFSAGILYTNDIDYHLAKHLAVSVIEEEPFEPVSDRAFERAKQMIRQCKKVINAGIVIGTTNRKMKELLVFAEEMGKLESYEK